MMDRRQLAIGAAAAGAVLLAGPAGAALRASAQPFFARHALPLGVQLYALAPDLDRDFDGTLAALNAIGVRTVETAGFHGHDAHDLRASLDRFGLRCTSAHIPVKPNCATDFGLGGDLDALTVALETIGITNVVLPSPPVTSAASFAAATGELT